MRNTRTWTPYHEVLAACSTWTIQRSPSDTVNHARRARRGDHLPPDGRESVRPVGGHPFEVAGMQINVADHYLREHPQQVAPCLRWRRRSARIGSAAESLLGRRADRASARCRVRGRSGARRSDSGEPPMRAFRQQARCLLGDPPEVRRNQHPRGDLPVGQPLARLGARATKLRAKPTSTIDGATRRTEMQNRNAES